MRQSSTGPPRAATLADIAGAGVIAVLRAPTWQSCLPVSRALLAGGVRVVEVTYSTPDTPRAIGAIAAEFGDDIIVGAGTVTHPRHAKAAAEAGSQFLVSPGTTPTVAAAMTRTELPCIMGAFTPSEILTVIGLGADAVKIFPGSLGGPSYLAGLRGPFPDLPAIPTGGVTLDNIGAWREASALAVGVGSALCPDTVFAAGDWSVVTERARAYQAAWQSAAAAR